MFIDDSHQWTSNRALAELDTLIASRHSLVGAGPSMSIGMYVPRAR